MEMIVVRSEGTELEEGAIHLMRWTVGDEGLDLLRRVSEIHRSHVFIRILFIRLMSNEEGW
jgi:hypothetical protein